MFLMTTFVHFTQGKYYCKIKMKLHLYAETNGTFARSKPRLTIAEHLSSPKQINARKGGLKIGCARMYEMNRATRRTAAHIFN